MKNKQYKEALGQAGAQTGGSSVWGWNLNISGTSMATDVKAINIFTL